jgi:AsnC-like helix-turn-helix protein
MEAYVLVQTDTRRRDVTDRIRALPQVVFAEDVSGPYDALALARSNGHGFDDVLGRIRELPGVIHALAAPLSGQVELADRALLATSDAA